MSELALIGFVLFLPLLGGIIAYLSKNRAGFVFLIFLGVSLSGALISTFIVSEPLIFRWKWMPEFSIGIQVDRVTILLISLVLFVTLLVSIFSVKYMEEESGVRRYFGKLGLFVFSMIGLLLADHLLLMFVFWELVGLSSYLLIGFWFKKESIPSSARTAFMVNRVADVALLSGILLVYRQTGNLFISEISGNFLIVPSVLIAIGAFGKSAQFPFSGWLTNAMVGPTPVSALIHAATMVAAGVYLLFRVAPFLHPNALILIALTGSITALYGGFCALNQHDIKKVLAYSTISQLGYMMMGIGVGARDASLFHLFTHAFFKAGLFLGAASVIHYLHKTSDKSAQDMRFMGGLKGRLPWTFRSFLFCGMALAGMPFFSGFLSKDGIIISAWTWANEIGTWAYIVPDIALITALITAFYVGRMILLIFWGDSRNELRVAGFMESRLFTFPLIILSVLSIWIFYSLNPLAHESWIGTYWGAYVSAFEPMISITAVSLSVILVAAGLTLAYSFFKPGTNYANSYHKIGNPSSFGGKFIFQGMFLTDVYKGFGRVIYRMAQWSSVIDKKIIDPMLHIIAMGSVVVSKVVSLSDRFLVDGPVNWIASLSAFVGKRFAGLSSRDLQTQLMWMLVAVILILGWIILF